MSGRWAGVKRRVLVEQCARKNATQCYRCLRGCRYVYALPQSASPREWSGWACKKCHRLSYRSQHAKALENKKKRLEYVLEQARLIPAMKAIEDANYFWKNGGDLRAPTMEAEPEAAQIK